MRSQMEGLAYSGPTSVLNSSRPERILVDTEPITGLHLHFETATLGEGEDYTQNWRGNGDVLFSFGCARDQGGLGCVLFGDCRFAAGAEDAVHRVRRGLSLRTVIMMDVHFAEQPE